MYRSGTIYVYVYIVFNIGGGQHGMCKCTYRQIVYTYVIHIYIRYTHIHTLYTYTYVIHRYICCTHINNKYLILIYTHSALAH